VQKKYFARNTPRGELFSTDDTKKFTKFFVNFDLSIADFEVFPKKKCILSYLSIGLSNIFFSLNA